MLVIVACWWWTAVMAIDMYGPMTGASAWMMTPYWDAAHLLLLWAMWAVMMIGMMLPSAAPMVLLDGDSRRRAGLAAGYVLVWSIFSIAATALQWTLARLLIITPMMEASSGAVGAVFLLIAGAYQWTPLKRACLTMCQSPAAFMMRKWRGGISGALRMGVEHGVHCVGCCWALMLLLFAGGVMNLWVIAALTVFVGLEKLVRLGPNSARFSGALLFTGGVWMLLR
jgi:predicted metal-binding membrane protein